MKAMKRTFGFLGAALAVSVVCACGIDADDGTDSAGADVTELAESLDVNDVSILFPLGPDGLPRPNLSLDDGSVPLMSARAFETITAFARSGSEGVKSPDSPTNVHPPEERMPSPPSCLPNRLTMNAGGRVVSPRRDVPPALAVLSCRNIAEALRRRTSAFTCRAACKCVVSGKTSMAARSGAAPGSTARSQVSGGYQPLFLIAEHDHLTS